MRAVLLWTAFLVCAGTVAAQDRAVRILVKGTYTTASELFPAPDAADPVERAFSLPLDGIPGIGLEVRYALTDLHLAFGLSVEYLSGTLTRRLDGLPPSVTVTDGFRAMPVELTGYFTLPFSGPSFSMHMGGGVGMYAGRRILRAGDAEASPVEETPGFGIHVAAGGTWTPLPWGAVVAELKFRDLQFETTSAFRQSTIIADGRLVSLPREPLSARFSTTGMIVQLGVMASF